MTSRDMQRHLFRLRKRYEKPIRSDDLIYLSDEGVGACIPAHNRSRSNYFTYAYDYGANVPLHVTQAHFSALGLEDNLYPTVPLHFLINFN